MPDLRLATFNVQNLFARFKFDEDIDPARATEKGWTANDVVFDLLSEESKKLTGRAIKELDADVVVCQEVENLDTLKKFRDEFLGGLTAFPYVVAVDGNDPRLIDVAVLSRLPICHVRSWQYLRTTNKIDPLFSRDCLEVDIAVEDSTVTLYVNHFKSMLDIDDPANGRKNTRQRRVDQAAKVMQIIRSRFGPRPGDHPWVVLGDLNDYRATDAQGESGILELVDWDQLENVVDRLPEEKDRWTHFFKGNNHVPAAYHQIDYILPSTSLAAQMQGLPEIMRKGLPTGADRYTGERFPGVGEDWPKASDHCPVLATIWI